MISPHFVSGKPALSPLELEELARLQKELAEKVVETPLPQTPRFIAGADMHLRGERAVAVAVCFELLSEPTSDEATDFLPLREVERAIAEQKVTFPYIPGFLSFREAPVIIEAVRALEQTPDLLVVDGQGRAHPRRCGLASHVGVLLDLPTIGAAKSRLYGSYREPGPNRGAWTPLVAEGEIIGAAVRTRPSARPLIVSVGHRITLLEAIRWVLRLSRYRIPEPTRWAHRYAKAAAASNDTGW
ncbi:MAG: deoxyribonuclease V [Thermomicrobium sp.]|jgi:deoxyribonuclease V|uniref:deoxyribonuclease V n=1 Tax=Thermomicrobium sp. TaxID=1969469 RepID=UPI001B19FFA9|nr:deoxyribonuclease V [Thermomicrobium sp.]MBO9358350.1 deoxyribonuclease V [Thermomicrobium sp.]